MKKLFFLLLVLILNLRAQTEFPVIKQYANDFTSTLTSSELYTLNSTLKNFQDTTSNQIVFLMINSLNGYPLESYTYEVASKNKIGTSKNNNGVLFFIAKDDRKMRIEVGYGLEGALPDALSNSILRNEVRPYFKNGEYSQGIASGLRAIMLATIGEYKNDDRDNEESGGKFPFGIIIMVIILIIISSRGGGRGRGVGGILPWLIIGSMGGRSHGGGSWGGGSGSGGGFGGFSGGGGSFGGGGSSGSW